MSGELGAKFESYGHEGKLYGREEKRRPEPEKSGQCIMQPEDHEQNGDALDRLDEEKGQPVQRPDTEETDGAKERTQNEGGREHGQSDKNIEAQAARPAAIEPEEQGSCVRQGVTEGSYHAGHGIISPAGSAGARRSAASAGAEKGRRPWQGRCRWPPWSPRDQRNSGTLPPGRPR